MLHLHLYAPQAGCALGSEAELSKAECELPVDLVCPLGSSLPQSVESLR